FCCCKLAAQSPDNKKIPAVSSQNFLLPVMRNNEKDFLIEGVSAVTSGEVVEIHRIRATLFPTTQRQHKIYVFAPFALYNIKDEKVSSDAQLNVRIIPQPQQNTKAKSSSSWQQIESITVNGKGFTFLFRPHVLTIRSAVHLVILRQTGSSSSATTPRRCDITAETMVFRMDEGCIELFHNVQVDDIDPRTGDSYRLSCEKLTIQRDSALGTFEKILIQNDIVFTCQWGRITANSGEYLAAIQTLKFTGKPLVYQGKSTLSGAQTLIYRQRKNGNIFYTLGGRPVLTYIPQVEEQKKNMNHP
ncbi:MAG: hypothetical protein D6820_00120, partial [Lentisphaerae bacterium]